MHALKGIWKIRVVRYIHMLKRILQYRSIAFIKGIFRSITLL